MPKIDQSHNRKKPTPAKPRKAPMSVPVLEEGGEEVRVSSVLFGLILISAIMVAGAAWMGGSLSKMERRVGNFVDATARSMGLAVEYVAVRGVSPQLTKDVRFAALIEPGENMFRANPHLIRQRVEETGLVTNVRVHRFWPNHVLIMVDPLEPIAQWQDGEDWAAVDGLGRRMPEEAVLASFEPAGDGAQIAGLTVSGAAAGKAAPQLIAYLDASPWLGSHTTRAHRISQSRWDLELVSGTSVLLPEDRRLAMALQRLEDLHEKSGLLERPGLRIDLRARQRVFVKPVLPAMAKREAGVRGG